MGIKSIPKEELEKIISENLIFIGAARERYQDGKRHIAFLPQGINRYFITDEFKSEERAVRLFRVYCGPQNLDGCKTYKKGMEIKPGTLYKLPDSIDETISKR